MDEARPITKESEMPKAFDPQAIEAGWYARWEADGLFVADPFTDKKTFTMCFPPPNITGELHMGHALQTAIYDLLARYKRMAGYEVLFLPGYDHAALATQNVIESSSPARARPKRSLVARSSTPASTRGTRRSARRSSTSCARRARPWTGRVCASPWTRATTAR